MKVTVNKEEMYFRTRTPKGDGNTLFRACNLKEQRRFQNTNPERGRKLLGLLMVFLCPVAFHFRTRTPKGDGNFASSDVIAASCLHFRTRTPKGDGNARLLARMNWKDLISEHEPRKGTETIQGRCNN